MDREDPTSDTGDGTDGGGLGGGGDDDAPDDSEWGGTSNPDGSVSYHGDHSGNSANPEPWSSDDPDASVGAALTVIVLGADVVFTAAEGAGLISAAVAKGLSKVGIGIEVSHAIYDVVTQSNDDPNGKHH